MRTRRAPDPEGPRRSAWALEAAIAKARTSVQRPQTITIFAGQVLREHGEIVIAERGRLVAGTIQRDREGVSGVILNQATLPVDLGEEYYVALRHRLLEGGRVAIELLGLAGADPNKVKDAKPDAILASFEEGKMVMPHIEYPSVLQVSHAARVIRAIGAASIPLRVQYALLVVDFGEWEVSRGGEIIDATQTHPLLEPYVIK